MKKKGLIWVIFILISAMLLTVSCSGKKDKEIVFADAGWDSVKFHNAIAGFIAENAFGYSQATETTGSSTVLHEGILKNEIDIDMEKWTSNIATYYDDLNAGGFKELGTNFDDNIQGIYVPRYVIEGDKERGIEPMAPELKTVADLKMYKDVFKDDEVSGKGRIYGAIPGWEIDTIMYNKYNYYGLNNDFIYFRPGSEAAMLASFTSAYEAGKPIVGYYWEPTWLMGKYDFVLLEDAPYDPMGYSEGKTACPSVNVTVAASNKFYEEDPEFCEFLSNYRTSSTIISDALAYMQSTGATHEETAKWFLSNNHELLDKWLDADKAEMVKTALGIGGGEEKINPFFTFPFKLPIDVEKIDSAVRGFGLKYEPFFTAIKNGLNNLILGIQSILDIIPWWLFIAGIFFGGWKVCGSLKKGIVYALMISIIGFTGLWSLMNETLAIVITSVIICLVFGFPIGIIVAGSEKINRIVRPILDTMQTMPVFVYLIPAILFFGLGKAPAVVATTIYAIVPVIRLTCHGIRQVDAEVVEASKSFGSTRFQTLWKVQIPQALPTIMTGVNQTLMMAMAMVVTCSMIGASGLGMEVLIGVNRIEIGRGLIAGIAVVIVAVLMDRLTQGLTEKKGADNS